MQLLGFPIFYFFLSPLATPSIDPAQGWTLTKVRTRLGRKNKFFPALKA